MDPTQRPLGDARHYADQLARELAKGPMTLRAIALLEHLQESLGEPAEHRLLAQRLAATRLVRD